MVEQLADKLNARREEFKKMAPQSAQTVMSRSAQALKDSNILDGARKAGDTAPDFVLKNVHGEAVSLEELRKEHRVVICFYRGGW